MSCVNLFPMFSIFCEGEWSCHPHFWRYLITLMISHCIARKILYLGILYISLWWQQHLVFASVCSIMFDYLCGCILILPCVFHDFSSSHLCPFLLETFDEFDKFLLHWKKEIHKLAEELQVQVTPLSCIYIKHMNSKYTFASFHNLNFQLLCLLPPSLVLKYRSLIGYTC